jgi:DNA-binding SARP family transcriptional activator
LGQSQSDLSSNPSFCSLNEEDSAVFSLIFLKGGNKNIKGTEANRFSKNVTALSEEYPKRFPKILEWYQKEMDRLTKEAVALKKKLLSVLSPSGLN